ncbi:MAG: methylmalonyl-CoA mutase [Actinobacteria bacterium]|nr:methylmalonyl-CoA mutase [Actinomycetota bacterium]
MTAPEAHLDLAGEFPAASREQWRSMLAAVLAKSGSATGDPEDALSHLSYDGLRIAPLYTAADLPDGAGLDSAGRPGEPPFVRGATAERSGWDVRQRVVEPDPEAANRAVLAELAGGASSVWLRVGAGGVPAESLARALDGVRLELAPIALDSTDTETAATALLDLLRARQLTDVAGTLGADPIGQAARQAPDLTVLARLAEAAEDFPRLQLATVDASRYAEAGGSDSDELAIGTATGVAYLRALTDAGLSVEQALAKLEFRFAVSADQWASMAKLRAARRLWDRVAELSGVSEQNRHGQRQHAVTAAATLTRRDPWVNLLRATVGCFAAAVAGAQAITVAPFDSALGLPDDFGRRIARNTQAILHDEASLARVLDPGGGSWYLESLTERLAEAAWAKFTAIERAGGALAGWQSGMITGLLEASWQRRRENLAHRRDPITGVSEFAMADEALLERRSDPTEQHGLPRRRHAAEFEALRDRSDARLAATGTRPRVFLAALGSARAHAGRLAFARNLLAAGGIEGVLGTGSQDELAAAYRAAGTPVALLCATDADYAEQAAPVAAVLRAAGADQVWIAGPPALVGDGIDAAVYAGCDAVAALTALVELLEVAA